MECINLSSLMQKEVISMCDGTKLGYITDLEIDVACGTIIFLIVKSKKCNTNFFCKSGRICKIKLKDVSKIGDETILVENFFCNDCDNS